MIRNRKKIPFFRTWKCTKLQTRVAPLLCISHCRRKSIFRTAGESLFSVLPMKVYFPYCRRKSIFRTAGESLFSVPEIFGRDHSVFEIRKFDKILKLGSVISRREIMFSQNPTQAPRRQTHSTDPDIKIECGTRWRYSYACAKSPWRTRTDA